MHSQSEKQFFLTNRRHFLKTGLATGAAALLGARFARAAEPGDTEIGRYNEQGRLEAALLRAVGSDTTANFLW